MGHSGPDLLTLSFSHFDRYCRKSLFAPSGPNFKSRWRANEKITWGDSSLGGELTVDFRSRTEGLSNGDRCLFCFQREISRSVFWDFLDSIDPERKCKKGKDREPF